MAGLTAVCRCPSCQHWLQNSPHGYLCDKGPRPVWVIRDCADYVGPEQDDG